MPFGVVDPRDDFRGRGACPRNERRPALGQPAIEGLVGVRHMPTGNQRTRDPWSPGRLSRIVEGRPQDRFDIQRHPERVEPGRHLAQAVDALTALLRQKRGQVRGGQIDEVPEHVHVAIVSHGRDFDAGDELDAGRRARGRRGFAAAHGVVIGDGHHGDAGRCRARDELRWRARPSDAVVWV